MEFSRIQTNVAYELTFREPAFEVPQFAVQILSSMYESLNPRFPIRMSDLQSTGGGALSDVALRIVLFNGNGSIEITVDKFSVQFDGLRTENDLTVAKDCVALSEEALGRAIPGKTFSATTIKTSSWLKFEGGATTWKDLLDRINNSTPIIPAEKFGATESKHRFSSELQNETEGWSVEILMEESQVSGANLFYMFDVKYLDDGRYNSLDERLEHLRTLYLEVLKCFELESKPSANPS